jgi:hypothetical protein
MYWTVFFQDRGKWRDVFEKAKTINIWSCNALRRRSRRRWVVMCHILAVFKFAVLTPWIWHKRAETCSSSERLYCQMLICLML